MRVVAGMVYLLIGATAVLIVWPSSSPPTDMTSSFLFAGWIAIGFLLFSVTCAAMLSARLRLIDSCTRGYRHAIVGGAMFLALLTGGVAFAVAGNASAALTQGLDTSLGPSTAGGLFSAMVAIGTAFGGAVPYLWLWRRAVRRQRGGGTHE